MQLDKEVICEAILLTKDFFQPFKLVGKLKYIRKQ
jgi:hypothetical protein